MNLISILDRVPMSCGQKRSLVFDISTSGVVQLRLGLTDLMKENRTQELLTAILLGILSILGVLSFMIPLWDCVLRLEMLDSLRMLKMRGR